MHSNGAVICFQKYTLGQETNRIEGSVSDSPVCLGYFGRVDIKPVLDFKEYVRIASRHGADQACSRKQLLVHRIDDKFDADITIASDDYRKDGGLPFCHSSGRKLGICCCTVLNISADVLKKGDNLKSVANMLFKEIKHIQSNEDFYFAITGLLGAEDLCVILLADRYDVISDVIGTIQKLRDNESSGYIVDNSHSILMLDTSGLVPIDVQGWGDAYAEIHFSLKSVAGINYLLHVKEEMAKHSTPRLTCPITLEGRTGEYDATIKCPAYFLGKELYGPSGLISYSNPEYQAIAYQSETIVYPFGCQGQIIQPVCSTVENLHEDKLFEKVTNAVKEIKQCILGSKDAIDNDFDYIELAIYRLLKDYRRIAAYPYSAELRDDFAEQFITAVNAIVVAAYKYKDPESNGSVSAFNSTFDAIVNDLSESFQAASQFDRLNFDEQPSYLQNIGSYHKILRCYYGIIKDILKLLYSIERGESSKQSTLVPLLSFGLTPIIVSKKYDSKYDVDDGQNEACLISIKLPYQALANPPKYLGILVHELFHYASPSDRRKRNSIIVNTLTRVALIEFIRMLAVGQKLGKTKHYGNDFYDSNREICNTVAENWAEIILDSVPDIRTAQADELKSVFPYVLNFHKDSTDGTYSYYFAVWKNLRKQLLGNDEAYNDDERTIFALDLVDNGEERIVEEAFAHLANSITSVDLARLPLVLSNCFRALGELPPDIFDVEFVLRGESSKRKLGQYLWQIHGTQRDYLAGAVGAETKPWERAAYLNITSIRMGFFIDYYLNQNGLPCGDGALYRCLEEWGASETKFAHIKSRFIHDYATYVDYSRSFAEPVMELCRIVLESIKELEKEPQCTKIMDKLTKYYKQYYELLDSLQQGEIEKEFFTKAMFNLCCDLIEAYQVQDGIGKICAQNLAVELNGNIGVKNSITKPVRPLLKCNTTFADDSASLSRAIYTAYKAMSPAGIMPVLWYRGQRLKHRESLPNIMRGALNDLKGANAERSHFLHLLQEELRWARANILPMGSEFTQADWLAFLQHNGFKTNVLDFSESLYPSLFFAVEKWADDSKKPPYEDAVVTMFNPVLFNLAMDALEQKRITERLTVYLKEGVQIKTAQVEPPLFATKEILDQYAHFFDWNTAINPKCETKNPRAVLIPKNCDRMKKQSGQFVFYDLHCARQKDSNGMYSYSAWSLESLHKKYEQLFDDEMKAKWYTPFMFNIIINHHCYKDFNDYLQAIGLTKYQIYPELDKLAEDLNKQLRLND